ncbi:hypothetical protein BD414DRAFT_491653 [Trametes punicea]|nr:hypothetical protein BD414DRAFT_491653 [Trametes punicea]
MTRRFDIYNEMLPPMERDVLSGDVYTARCWEARYQRVSEYEARLRPLPENKTKAVIDAVKLAIARGEPIVPKLHFGFYLSSAELGDVISNRIPKEFLEREFSALGEELKQDPGVQSLAILQYINSRLATQEADENRARAEQGLPEKTGPKLFRREETVSMDADAVVFTIYSTKREWPMPSRSSMNCYADSLRVFKEEITAQREPHWYFDYEEHCPESHGWKPFDAKKVAGTVAPLLTLLDQESWEASAMQCRCSHRSLDKCHI